MRATAGATGRGSGQGDGGEPAAEPVGTSGPEDDSTDEVHDPRSGQHEEVVAAFERTVDEGRRRLHRSSSALLATGAVGGMDVGVGVFALMLVLHETGSVLLGALAFGIGFIALSLANSELFTENFLVPVTAAAAERSSPLRVLRLWVGTAVANLAGGWVLMAFTMSAFPRLRETAIDLAGHYVEMGLGVEAFSAAVLGGVVITLMTWMEHSTESVPAKLLAVVGAAFLLAAGPLNHAIVSSLEFFAALQAGAPFGYLDWLGALGWATLGNMVGGVGLVTVLRLVQVGRAKVQEEQDHVEHEEG